jgi:hypothetical protein
MKTGQNGSRQRHRSRSALRLSMLLWLACACAAAPALAVDFNFGVIGQAFARSNGEAALRRALDESDADNLAFVVVNGINRPPNPAAISCISGAATSWKTPRTA